MNYKGIIHERDGKLFFRVIEGSHWVDHPANSFDIEEFIRENTIDEENE